jgi:polysaccharide biosynthesis protein PslH
MRILLLCNKSPWPPKDGGSAATLNIIKGLSTLNVSVSVLAINTSKHFVKADEIHDNFLRSTEYQLINVNTGINPLKLLSNLVFSRRPYNLERFWSRKYNSVLKSAIRRNFDIIQIEGLSMYHYLSTLRQNTSAVVIFRPHNIENLIWARLAVEEKNFLRRSYFRILSERIKKLEKNIINKFDGLLAISNSDMEWFKSAGLSIPVTVVSQGFSPEEMMEYSEVPSNKVCFIGALDWLPNILGLNWFIEEVWPMVVNRVPDAEFFVAGRNASKKTISGIKGPGIIFSGEVESSSLFIKDKTVMVVPLFSGSGIRIKIIEGMLHGKSIVATPVAVEGLNCEDKTDILIESDPFSFASEIVKLLNNPYLRREIGENAIRNVRKNCDIFVSSENLMNFYRELLHDN